jgi:hypothetical protein
MGRFEDKLDLIVLLLCRQDARISRILRRVRKIMATIDQVLQDVTDESTLEDSIITLLTNIKAQLDAALANQNIPADVQAKIDSVFEGLEANKTKVADAIKANTPAA